MDLNRAYMSVRTVAEARGAVTYVGMCLADAYPNNRQETRRARRAQCDHRAV